MDYIEVDIKVEKKDPFSEILIARLNDIDFESFVEEDCGVKAYIQRPLFSMYKLKEVINDVKEMTNVQYNITDIDSFNWNEHWENNFLPVNINERCVVRADFHSSFEDIDYELVINPKMSFGTGHHATTYLMMNQLFVCNVVDRQVLDIGSGTGILAILASKLKSSKVVAIDIDHNAYKNAIENALLNGISDIDFIYGDINLIIDSKFDLLLANINRNIILKDMAFYYSVMNNEADLIMSGFYDNDKNKILTKASQLGFSLVDSKNKDKWLMLHLRKA
tara:strand:- start:316 stop:1149 length:834 start_codon:yes stop_codon:yes gene_type:complete